ncbi:Proline synthase co-transcribed bacterial protein [Ananas comosus]|uniref:Proline synthase co-transcribed bacterial protein n=1 Tax=Ananas comosus TaxID=4615 RepID=A0A199VI92_ANACO|nr:Proline synthase co-transcribed bacterial protein [Ananas comosus]
MAQQVLLPLSPANEERPNDATSYSPTPTPMKSGNPNTSHASTHTSSGKRRRLSSPSHKTTPTLTRKGKLEYTSDAIQELVNLGKKRLNIAEQMLQRELDACPKVHSIEECMLLLGENSEHPELERRKEPLGVLQFSKSSTTLKWSLENAIGAIDGTDIPVVVRKSKQPRYHCRKGYTSQNMMISCSFDHQFLFVCTGWEGSAVDMRALHCCCESGGFMVSEVRRRMSAPAAAALEGGAGAAAALRAVVARVRQAAERCGRRPERVKVVAVSKTKPPAVVRHVYDAGHRCFGENYVQELLEKAAQLPADIEWHFIGHLQSNKVKSLLGIFYLLTLVVNRLNFRHGGKLRYYHGNLLKRPQKASRQHNSL